MSTKSIFALLFACFAAFAGSPAPGADDPMAVAARKIFYEKQESIVWVSAVAKISFSAEGAKELPMNLPDQESKVEALGTLIDPAGLVVTALNQVDPGRNLTGREYRMGGTLVKIEATATLKEVKVTMPDGTEIPSEIVMKDADLDLAFVQIKTASKEARTVNFKPLDLKASGTGLLADEVVTIGRMDEVLHQVATLTRGQINGATLKPRAFFRAAGAAQGCPTFLMDGRLLGIAATRSARGKPSYIVVIPAADVLEIAQQAKRAAPPAQKDSKSTAKEKGTSRPE